MEPNGLMEHWRRLQSYSITKLEEVGPQVLTMDHLRIGFLACCIPLALAVIAFIGECAWSKYVAVCKKSSNDSNFERSTEVISEIEFFDPNLEEPEKEQESIIEMRMFSKTAMSRKSLEDSNEQRVETTFQIEEKVDEFVIKLCNFDETAACSQRILEVKFVDGMKNSIEKCCVDNAAQDEHDEIDDLIDRIDFTPFVKMNQTV